MTLLRLAVCAGDFLLLGVLYMVLTTAPCPFTFAISGGALWAWWRTGKHHHWTDPWI